MEIISIPTRAQRIERMATCPVQFAREVETEFDPRPCQAELIRWVTSNDNNRSVGITRKQRQTGASTSLFHAIAWSMFVKDSGWRAYIVAPNEAIAAEDFEPIFRIFEDTPILRPYLKDCKKNEVKFELGYKANRVQILLVGDDPNSKRGIRFNNEIGGILLSEEIDQLNPRTMSNLRPATSWGALAFYISTPADYSGPYYNKYKQILREQNKGNPRYRVFDFPLRQFLAIPENDNKGIGIDFLREMKEQEPHHVYMREYLGLFCSEGSSDWFGGNMITKAWQNHQQESITYDDNKPLVLGVDWGTFDRSVLTYAQDNVIEDRLEVIDIKTFREKKYAKDGDQHIRSLDDVVKAVCNMRDRGWNPQCVYVDRNNRGGVFCDKLQNEHGFNIVDCSWNSYEAKLRALNGLRNLIKSGSMIFPRDERLLFEFNRFCPLMENGKWQWKDRNDDIIVTLCNISTHLGRDNLPMPYDVAVGQPNFQKEVDNIYGQTTDFSQVQTTTW